MRKPAVLAIFLGFLAAGAWLLLGNGSPDPEVSWNEKASPSPQAAPPAPAAAETASPKTPAASRPARQSPDLRRKQVASSPSQGGERPLLEFRVVEKESGKPVPGAEIRILDPDAMKDPGAFAGEAFLGLGKMDALMEKYGRRYLTDRKGRAWIRVSLDAGMGTPVTARKGDLWGSVFLGPGKSSPVVIRVSPVKTLLVQVKDTLGRPVAGVPVGLGRRTGPFRFFSQKGRTEGPEGIARFRILGSMRSSGGGSFAALLVPLKEPVEKDVDLENPPEKPLVLTLPSTGSLVVQVLDPSGPLPDGSALVTVTKAPEKNGGPPFLGMTPFGSGISRKVKDGKAVFPFIGPGLKLLVTGRRISGVEDFVLQGPGKSPRVEVEGPPAPGSTASCELFFPPPPDRPILAGRILLPTKKPASRVTLHWTLRVTGRRGGYSNSFFTKTDAQGKFRIKMPPHEEGEEKAFLVFSLPAKAMEVRTELALPLPPGVTDLGDLFLVALPLLAEGKVVDPSGKPLEGAAVRALPPNRIYGPGRRSFSLRRFSTVTGPKGRFELRGKAEGMDRIRLRASKRGWIQEKSVLVPKGARKVTLVLRKGGSLEAAFLLDPGVSLERLHVSLSMDSNGKTRFFSPRIMKNKAVWEGLPSGTASLDVRAGPMVSSSPLVRIPDIPIVAGRKNRDPRLEPLDLRGRLRSFRIEVVDASGKKIQPFFLGLGGKPDEILPFVSQGQTLLLPREKADRLLVSAPGYRDKEVSLTDKKIRVVLEKGIEARLVLKNKEALPEAPFSLGARLRPEPGGKEGAGGRSFFPFFVQRTTWFDRDGALTLRVSDPGRYQVVWLLKKEGKNFSRSTILSSGKPVLTLEDRSGPQVFTVEAPVKEIQKTLKAWAKE